MKTIRITITSPEIGQVVLKEVEARPLALKDKLAALFQMLRLKGKTEKKPRKDERNETF